MDKEMLERCIAAADKYWLDVGFDPSNNDAGLIIAIIKAMREPTDGMIEVGLMRGTNLTTGQPSARLAARSAGERMRDQWQSMIDAITGDK